jgi:hypothetical protein
MPHCFHHVCTPAHRCGWKAYVGKPAFLKWGFTPAEFEILSWATGVSHTHAHTHTYMCTLATSDVCITADASYHSLLYGTSKHIGQQLPTTQSLCKQIVCHIPAALIDPLHFELVYCVACVFQSTFLALLTFCDHCRVGAVWPRLCTRCCT